MTRLLLVSILWACSEPEQDPHEIVEDCAVGQTCEWACAVFQTAESYGDSCTADDGYRCPRSWTVAGTEFRGCCVVGETAVFHECL